MIGVALIVAICQVSLAGPTEPEVMAAIERSLPYLARQGESWMEERGCVSCHHVPFMIWAHNEARAHGLDIDSDNIRSTTNWAIVNMLAEREESGGADTISQMLLGRDRQSSWRKKPPRHFKTVDPYETLFLVLLERQKEDGSWPPEGQLSTPPELTTGWALLALASRNERTGDPGAALDPDDDLGDELARLLETVQQRIPESSSRALEYLKGIKPHQTNEGLVLRALLEPIYRDGQNDLLRQQLLAAQKSDGGWSNRFELSKSDAYATGQSLYALSRIGRPDDQSAITKAHRFLLESQREDGSWNVSADRVRAGMRNDSLDEVFTYWGTAWASIGLLKTMPDDRTPGVAHE
jgi:squalene-hopene/tetraprenyl-beta-curcumene cyclase